MPVTASAPGKLMIMGEHAVVYGQPCIVTAVSQRMYASVSKIDEPVFQLIAKDVGIDHYSKKIRVLGIGDIPKGAWFAERALKNFLDAHSMVGGVRIETSADFLPLFGFGSSSASVAAILKALFVLADIEHADDDIFRLGLKTVLDVQGKGSGFDVASAVYGGTILYSREKGMIRVLPSIPLVVGYSGQKADTVQLIDEVAKRGEARGGWEDTYGEIGTLVLRAADLFHRNGTSVRDIGMLMNKNQQLLHQLGVSTPALDAMIDAAIRAGAYGSKLSGAGGGDCMIALADDEYRAVVAAAITQAGGQVIDVETGVEGVRIESGKKYES